MLLTLIKDSFIMLRGNNYNVDQVHKKIFEAKYFLFFCETRINDIAFMKFI